MWRPSLRARPRLLSFFFFFFNDTATTEIYTLSLHDALPIWLIREHRSHNSRYQQPVSRDRERSEEHTSELQSRPHLVCRLLLEKKKKKKTHQSYSTQRFDCVVLCCIILHT